LKVIIVTVLCGLYVGFVVFVYIFEIGKRFNTQI
jgi:hypothetical protein